MSKPPLLELRDLNAWYGEGHALHGVNLEVREGETVTLLGRNGVGKTTTLRAIMGIVAKRSGAILIDGQDVTRTPLHRMARRGVGFVPEERGVFASLSVDENLSLPPVVAKGGLSLAEIYELFPNLKERRNSGGAQLSGGEQQMLAIARMLRTGVRLLLLDEPTEGLAPVIVQRIGEIIQEMKRRGLTVLLVEQNFRFAAKVADRFYVMDHGVVVDDFDVGELPGRMAKLTETLGV
ncbi:ABC transporter ATP-binding protein [Hansschlegelia zhihuaiae]|uniref:ABC transporter ATP-binding protein n=1 Tax=Hansschlegelia zhihuaiae TaxID=405005 RepID=A0A4Q0MM89_9HYPH|nr:ABC transporter ATP-binding protein [Hansschlegelia zhihuaiae]RXF74189.1 ABC transporter ATP-binding protein [Hansschlegelia zhihuaiae]